MLQGIAQRRIRGPDQPVERLVEFEDQKNGCRDRACPNEKDHEGGDVAGREQAEADEEQRQPEDEDDQKRHGQPAMGFLNHEPAGLAKVVRQLLGQREDSALGVGTRRQRPELVLDGFHAIQVLESRESGRRGFLRVPSSCHSGLHRVFQLHPYGIGLRAVPDEGAVEKDDICAPLDDAVVDRVKRTLGRTDEQSEDERGQRGDGARAELHQVLHFPAEVVARQEALQGQSEKRTAKDAGGGRQSDEQWIHGVYMRKIRRDAKTPLSFDRCRGPHSCGPRRSFNRPDDRERANCGLNLKPMLSRHCGLKPNFRGRAKGPRGNVCPILTRYVCREYRCEVLFMIKVLDRIRLAETVRNAATYVYTDYARVATREKVRLAFSLSRSDTHDSCRMSFSDDEGKSWRDERSLPVCERRAEGTLRTHYRMGFADPVADRFLWLYFQGLLRGDDPKSDGIRSWHLRYGVSKDAGRTMLFDEPVVQEGAEYSEYHPLEAQFVGRNAVQIGDFTCRPIRTSGGKILQPVQFTVLDDAGEISNPGGGYTWHEAAVLIGTWKEDHRMRWNLSHRVRIDSSWSTRGAVEPTLAEFGDGRILMVLRASNDSNREMPSYRWAAISNDGGWTWSDPSAWSYDDGSLFFSPSSCSLLLKHSNGEVYWIGNITPNNPVGNGPRYPLVIGRVCQKTLSLIKSSISVIDTRHAEDSEHLTLSNFSAHEDLATSDILLHMSRPFHLGARNWTSDAFLYRIQVG